MALMFFFFNLNYQLIISDDLSYFYSTSVSYPLPFFFQSSYTITWNAFLVQLKRILLNLKKKCSPLPGWWRSSTGEVGFEECWVGGDLGQQAAGASPLPRCPSPRFWRTCCGMDSSWGPSSSSSVCWPSSCLCPSPTRRWVLPCDPQLLRLSSRYWK